MKTPVSKGTVRVLVGLVAFPAAWITAAVLTTDGAAAGALVVLTAAIGALAAVWLIERVMALAVMLLRWQAQRERIGTLGLAAERPRRGGRRRAGGDADDRGERRHARRQRRTASRSARA